MMQKKNLYEYPLKCSVDFIARWIRRDEEEVTVIECA